MHLYESFIELNGRERAQALLDEGSFHEILDPFQQIESPHLVPQGIVPESDDVVIIAEGTLNGHKVVILSIEGKFQGGGMGEVSGSKIAGALEKALLENENGQKVIPIILFDTGGVRLQEANYGLLTISEMQAAIVALRKYVPVIGLIPGSVGSFGGMSITASLCSALIATKVARYGLNGPEVIEQEAGIQEFDSKDKTLIYYTIGGVVRQKVGLVDEIVEDDINEFKNAVLQFIDQPPITFRTQKANQNLRILSNIDASKKLSAENIETLRTTTDNSKFDEVLYESKPLESRGRTWFNLLTQHTKSYSINPSVLIASAKLKAHDAVYISVVPDEGNKFYRAHKGEVDLLEGLTFGKYVHEIIEADKDKAQKRVIVCIIDVPSQAYGYNEELFGIHTTCATAIDAYASVRIAGHKVVGLIVGNAISGAFLTHGYQASVLIGVDDEHISIQAMSKQSAARITKRTVQEIEEAAKSVPAIAYDINSYNKLGGLESLLENINADQPSEADVARVVEELDKSLAKVTKDLSARRNTPNALKGGRKMSNLVREKISNQWI